MRLLKPPHTVVDGAGESSLGVPEQFRLKQIFGDRRAVHGNHPASSAPAGHVNGASHHFLAGSRLARDQHRRLPRTHQPDHRVQRPHRLAFSHQQFPPRFARLAGFFLSLRARLNGGHDDARKVSRIERAGDMPEHGHGRPDNALVEHRFGIINYYRNRNQCVLGL